MNDGSDEARRFPRTFRRCAGLLVLGLTLVLIVACGEGGGEPQPSSPGGDDLGSISGRIRIDGSSTVFPISQAVAEEFNRATDVTVDVASSGTGGGFERFCRGETQISDASRPIEQDEREACAQNGINDVIEFQVAIDALTVMVHPSNDFVDCLTVEELHNLFRTGGAQRWSDVRPEWPDDKIDFFYPGTDSGTFDYFVESIIEAVDENATHRGDGTASEDDNALAIGIENDQNAIGYFGFAYYQEAGQQLKAVAVDGGNGCVEPSFETALDGSYTPLSRPLFIYTRERFLRERPEVREFVRFYLENSPELVPAVGYVTMADATLQQQLAKLEPFLQ